MKSSEKTQPILENWEFPDDQHALMVYSELLAKFEVIFESIYKDTYRTTDLDAYMEDFLLQTLSSGWALFRIFLSGSIPQPTLGATSFHTALVSVLFARTSNWSDEKTVLLTRSAFLHDLGMLYVPKPILEKQGKLSIQERALIDAHVSAGYERVKDWGEAYELTQISLQHHEEWNGGGYPKKLENDQIYPLAALMGLIDNFVARVTQRSYRNSLVGYWAIKQLIKEQSTRFSPSWVKQFVDAFGFNPPGSIVLLSDASIARVLENNPQMPLRPKLRILIDSVGTQYRQDAGPVLNLQEVPKLFIARPINFQDILDAKNS